MRLRMPACSIAAGRRIETMTVIQICGGATFSRICKQSAITALRTASQIGSDYYPETLGCYLILDPPGWFPYLWAIIKTFIDEKTRTMIKVVPQAEQMTELLKIIDLENIPAFLGGKCQCLGTVTKNGLDRCFLSNKGPW